VTIDADVQRIARQFGVDPSLIQAVVQAEGDILKAVRCSVPSCKDRQQAIEITCRSAVHALSDFVKQGHGAAFVQFWARRWAPVGATNDPTRLNENWPVNVSSLWLRGVK
jgi:deoxyribose-phosphate aldolase